MVFLKFSVFLFVVAPCLSARILVMSPVPLFSHQAFFYPLWHNLSQRGHELTIITPHPMNNRTLTNVTEIDISFLNDLFNYKKILIEVSNSVRGLNYVLWLTYHELPHKVLGHTLVQEVIHNKSEHFDLVMVESSSLSGYALAQRFNCPLIPITLLSCESYNYRAIGNPEAYFSPNRKKCLTIAQRVKYAFYDVLQRNLVRSTTSEVITKIFGSEYSDIDKIFSRISVLFENTNNIWHPIRPLMPSVIQIGGLNLDNVHEDVSQHLQKLMDNATKGFVYVSFGTVLDGKDISTLFLETFRELPYNVLWKIDGTSLTDVPDHVYTSKWFPQFNVLRHKHMKLFITQGGALSVDEAIYNEVPMLGMPGYLDQFVNCDKLEEFGIGLRIDRNGLHKQLLKSKILEVAENAKYRQNIAKLNKLIMDQPETALDKAVFWTEYVIRHKGVAHLKSPILNIPFYQYYLLDVFAVFTVLILLTIYVLRSVVKFVKKSLLAVIKIKIKRL